MAQSKEILCIYMKKTEQQDLLRFQEETAGGHYTLRVEFPADACPAGFCYVVSAVPQGSQAEDACGTLSLTSDGDRLPAGCW